MLVSKAQMSYVHVTTFVPLQFSRKQILWTQYFYAANHHYHHFVWFAVIESIAAMFSCTLYLHIYSTCCF